jgi:hypothetical protein
MLKAPDSQNPEDTCLCFHATDKARALEHFTDADGAFEFFEALEGHWWIGPGIPEESNEEAPLAPCARQVTISRAGLPSPFNITAEAGRYIDVKVMSQLLPIDNCMVKAMSEECGGMTLGLTSNGGIARIGPIKRVEYSISAGGCDEYRQSDWQRVDPDVGNVTIELTKGLSMRGMIREQDSGNASPAAVMLSDLNVPNRAWWAKTDQFGCFVFDGLPASNYGVAVITERGHVGLMERLAVQSDECCDVLVSKGATLSVNYEGEDSCVLSQYRRGVLISSTRIKPGEQSITTMPGLVTLELEAAGIIAGNCQVIVSQKRRLMVVVTKSQDGRLSFQARR